MPFRSRFKRRRRQYVSRPMSIKAAPVGKKLIKFTWSDALTQYNAATATGYSQTHVFNINSLSSIVTTVLAPSDGLQSTGGTTDQAVAFASTWDDMFGKYVVYGVKITFKIYAEDNGAGAPRSLGFYFQTADDNAAVTDVRNFAAKANAITGVVGTRNRPAIINRYFSMAKVSGHSMAQILGDAGFQGALTGTPPATKLYAKLLFTSSKGVAAGATLWSWPIGIDAKMIFYCELREALQG